MTDQDRVKAEYPRAYSERWEDRVTGRAEFWIVTAGVRQQVGRGDTAEKAWANAAKNIATTGVSR